MRADCLKSNTSQLYSCLNWGQGNFLKQSWHRMNDTNSMRARVVVLWWRSIGGGGGAVYCDPPRACLLLKSQYSKLGAAHWEPNTGKGFSCGPPWSEKHMANLHKLEATPPLPGRLVLVISGHEAGCLGRLGLAPDNPERAWENRWVRTPAEYSLGSRDSPHGPASTNYCLAAELLYKGTRLPLPVILGTGSSCWSVPRRGPSSAKAEISTKVKASPNQQALLSLPSSTELT